MGGHRDEIRLGGRDPVEDRARRTGRDFDAHGDMEPGEAQLFRDPVEFRLGQICGRVDTEPVHVAALHRGQRITDPRRGDNAVKVHRTLGSGGEFPHVRKNRCGSLASIQPEP